MSDARRPDRQWGRVRCWLSEPLPRECRSALQRLSDAEDVEHVAVMPDVHLVDQVCNGVALATSDRLYPQAVGGDIGCGILAVAVDIAATALRDERIARAILDGLGHSIPSNRHSAATAAQELPLDLRRDVLSTDRLTKLAARDGRVQLGTLGRGNHFVELQADSNDQLWIMIHSGSRGIGQAISHWHLETARRECRLGLVSLSGTSVSGQDFLHDVDWARRYASENRRAMLRAVERLLHDHLGASCDWSSLIETDHDHVQREMHSGRELWVHRKGAQPAANEQLGLIPGSMGTCSFVVRGRGCSESLHSSSHGAGRPFSRTVARQRIGLRQLANEMRAVWFDERFSDLLRDEAPSAYKDVRAVMRAQTELTSILRELRPVLVFKR